MNLTLDESDKQYMVGPVIGLLFHMFMLAFACMSYIHYLFEMPRLFKVLPHFSTFVYVFGAFFMNALFVVRGIMPTGYCEPMALLLWFSIGLLELSYVGRAYWMFAGDYKHKLHPYAWLGAWALLQVLLGTDVVVSMVRTVGHADLCTNPFGAVPAPVFYFMIFCKFALACALLLRAAVLYTYMFVEALLTFVLLSVILFLAWYTTLNSDTPIFVGNDIIFIALTFLMGMTPNALSWVGWHKFAERVCRPCRGHAYKPVRREEVHEIPLEHERGDLLGVLTLVLLLYDRDRDLDCVMDDIKDSASISIVTLRRWLSTYVATNTTDIINNKAHSSTRTLLRTLAHADDTESWATPQLN